MTRVVVTGGRHVDSVRRDVFARGLVKLVEFPKEGLTDE